MSRADGVHAAGEAVCAPAVTLLVLQKALSSSFQKRLGTELRLGSVTHTTCDSEALRKALRETASLFQSYPWSTLARTAATTPSRTWSGSRDPPRSAPPPLWGREEQWEEASDAARHPHSDAPGGCRPSTCSSAFVDLQSANVRSPVLPARTWKEHFFLEGTHSLIHLRFPIKRIKNPTCILSFKKHSMDIKYPSYFQH